MRIKKGDKVQVISGKDRGKQASVVRAMPAEGRVGQSRVVERDGEGGELLVARRFAVRRARRRCSSNSTFVANPIR